MRLRGGYIEGAAEKGGDANVEKRQELSEKQEELQIAYSNDCWQKARQQAKQSG